MLAQKYRINRRLFDQTFTLGQFFGGSYFAAKVYKLEPSGLNSRFACVISKKNLKRGVDRNRLRRRVYGAISPLLAKIHPGFAIIIIAKPTVLTMPFDKLTVEIENFLRLLKIYD